MSKEQGILKIELNTIPEYKDAVSKQQEILKANPFVPIEDFNSYELAKKNRTALRQGRYDLQKGEKAIAAKIKTFRDFVKEETIKLVSITLDAENKQQEEVVKYENKKEEEKREAARKEEERINGHKRTIREFREFHTDLVRQANTIERLEEIQQMIETFEKDVEEFADDLTVEKQILNDSIHEQLTRLKEVARLKEENERQAKEREKMELEQKKLEEEKKKLEDARLKQEKEIKDQQDKLAREKKEFERMEQERLDKLEAEKKEAELFGELKKTYFNLTGKEPTECKTSAQLKISIQTFEENERIAKEKQALYSHQKKFKGDKEILTKYFETFNTPTKEGDFQLDNEESNKIYILFQDDLRNMAIKYIELTKNL